MGWFDYPLEADQTLWRAAVREVASLDADPEALEWVDRLDEFWSLMDRAGLIVGSRNHMLMAPEEKALLYDELDRVLGIP